MHNTKPAQTPARSHSRITHTRLSLRASRPEEGLRRFAEVCGGDGVSIAGYAGYYLPRTVTNARQRHFHSHPQLPPLPSSPLLPLPLRRALHRCLLLLPPSSSSCLSGARNVTSISSSGPTRHLCQPSEGASGDCDGTTTIATAALPTLLHRRVSLAARSRYVYVKSKKVREAMWHAGRRSSGRKRLDVSRPHVIPSYSTLSVRRTNFCRTENIRGLLHDFAPVKNRYCPSPPRWRSPFRASSARIFGQFFLLTALSNDLCSLFLFDRPIVHPFFLAAVMYEPTAESYL